MNEEPMNEATEVVPTVEDPAPASRTDAIVDAWFADTFHNLGLDVELYNRFHAAKEALKAALKGE